MSINKDPFYLRELKGRYAEEVVRIGFGQLGFDVHRIGIEHTRFSELYGIPSAYKQALFWQMRRSPDFLVVNKKDNSFHFLEVKFRKELVDSEFEKDLVHIYLGGTTRVNGIKPKRPGAPYFGMNDKIQIILLTPHKAFRAKLGSILTSYQAKDTKDWLSGVSEKWCQNRWPATKDEPMKTHWATFSTFWDKVKGAIDWSKVR